jgi:hypothetical protein
MSAGPDKPIPAYIPWETFKGFIGHLKATVVPSHIDKSMMPAEMPALTRGQVQTALKFLGLVDLAGQVRQPLRTLVGAYDTDGWPNAVKVMIQEPYSEIIGDLNINTATPQQVDERFSDVGVTGQMLQKSLRFYLSALKDANVPCSPHLGARRKRSASPKKRTAGKALIPKEEGNAPPVTPSVPPPPPIAAGMRTYPLYFRGKQPGSIVVPDDLNAADCTVIALQLEVLKASAKE